MVISAQMVLENKANKWADLQKRYSDIQIYPKKFLNQLKITKNLGISHGLLGFLSRHPWGSMERRSDEVLPPIPVAPSHPNDRLSPRPIEIWRWYPEFARIKMGLKPVMFVGL